jgi:hypothetical protein
MKSIEFIFGDNATATSSIIIDTSASKTEVFYNNLQHADNSFKLKIPFSVALSNKIKADLQNDVKAFVKDDDGSNYFCGYIRKSIDFQKTQSNQPISMELVSPSFLLDKTVEKGKVYINKSVTYIITDLLSLAGFSDIKNIGVEDTVSVCTIDEDDNIKDVINELLQEYKKTYDFDSDGYFYTSDILNVPDTLDITQSFAGDNIRESIKIEAREREADYIEASWDKIEYKENVLLFSDTSGQTDSHKCEITIAANSYFAQTHYNYLTYDSTYGTVVYVDSIAPKIKTEPGITCNVTRTDEDGDDLGTKCMLVAHNDNDYDADIVQLDVYGNAFINTGSNKNVSTTGHKKKSVELKYLNNEDSVKSYVAALADYYHYADNTITLKSTADYVLGSFVRITDYGIGVYYGRIIQKVSRLATAAIEYKIETINDFTAAQVSDSKTTSNSKNTAGSQSFGDFAPPTVPVIESVTLDSRGYVTVFINPSSDDESGVSLYKLYRKEGNESYSILATLDHTGENVTYIDKSATPGFSYTYAAVAVDKAGNQSAKSVEKSVTVKVTAEPQLVTSLTAVANNPDRINLTYAAAAAPSEETKPAFYKIFISRDSGETYNYIDQTGELYYFYYFNRDTDGYPEKADLADYKFKITTVSVSDVESSSGAETTVDTADYGTWIATKPVISSAVTGRNVTLQMMQQATTYGTVNYMIQIKKLSAAADTSFCKPDLSTDPYENLTGYKDGEGYITTSGSFSQTLPLNGQDDGNPEATSYQYNVIPYTAAGDGEANTVTLSALPSSAKDLVDKIIDGSKLADGTITKEKIGAKEITGDLIAATNLAANGATLGEISGNAIGTSSNNYWKGLDTSQPEFRIGNDIALETAGDDKAVFFHFSWLDGVANLAMKLNNFILTSVASIIKGIFRVKADGAADSSSFLTVNPTDSTDATTGTPAKTVQVKGYVKVADSILSGNGNRLGNHDISKYVGTIGYFRDAVILLCPANAKNGTVDETLGAGQICGDFYFYIAMGHCFSHVFVNVGFGYNWSFHNGGTIEYEGTGNYFNFKLGTCLYSGKLYHCLSFSTNMGVDNGIYYTGWRYGTTTGFGTCISYRQNKTDSSSNTTSGTIENSEIYNSLDTSTYNYYSREIEGNTIFRKNITVDGTINGNLTGNAGTATRLKTSRAISITDADGSNAGTEIPFDGTSDKVLKLPDVIKATLRGNADTATLAKGIDPVENQVVNTENRCYFPMLATDKKEFSAVTPLSILNGVLMYMDPFSEATQNIVLTSATTGFNTSWGVIKISVSNGLILQWIRAASASRGGTVHTFPISFTNSSTYVAVCSTVHNGGAWDEAPIYQISGSQIKICQYDGAPCNIIAIGY